MRRGGSKVTDSTVTAVSDGTATHSHTITVVVTPVNDPPTVNVTRAGSSVPVKFSLGGDQGLGILKPGYPLARPAECTAGLSGSELTETETASQSGLRYDAAADQYVYVWKTERSWAGSCWQFDIGLNDNSSHSILVHFPAR